MATWPPQQDRALKAVDRWFHHESETKKTFRLFGYAGTGKTTLARHFAEAIQGTVLFAAFTGKAAHVLQTKGCTGAMTIHQLIYSPSDRSANRAKELAQAIEEEGKKEEPNQAYIQRLKRELQAEKNDLSRPMFSLNMQSELKRAKLLIVDECSMVDERMGEDLESFGVPILVLGDPAQLPPVRGTGYFTQAEPDFLLTEVHRQAKDSPIIHLATTVREGNRLQTGTYGDSVVANGRPDPSVILRADQVLVGRNSTRRGSNNRVRELKGFSERGVYPLAGDRLVCLRNDHEEGLLNGQIWYAAEDSVEVDDEDVAIALLDGPVVNAHARIFRGQEVDFWGRKNAQEFDYGYALTVHKAQGSQWDEVVLFDESSAFRANRHQWLYTGITRAAERIKIVLL